VHLISVHGSRGAGMFAEQQLSLVFDANEQQQKRVGWWESSTGFVGIITPWGSWSNNWRHTIIMAKESAGIGKRGYFFTTVEFPSINSPRTVEFYGKECVAG